MPPIFGIHCTSFSCTFPSNKEPVQLELQAEGEENSICSGAHCPGTGVATTVQPHEFDKEVNGLHTPMLPLLNVQLLPKPAPLQSELAEGFAQVV